MNVLCFTFIETQPIIPYKIYDNILACVHCISLFSYVNSYEPYIFMKNRKISSRKSERKTI